MDDDNEATGVIEEDVARLVEAVYQESADKGERAAANILAMAKKGSEERRAFIDHGCVPALCSLCTRENEARTQAKAALALGALCSNYATTLNDADVYVHQEAQSEALNHGAVALLVPVLTSWQPDAQAAAAEALANLGFQNSDARKQMQTCDTGKALVNLLHSENVDVHRSVLCALRAYAIEGKYASELHDRGCLTPTYKLVHSDKPDVQARALRLLWAMALADPIKTKIVKENAGKLLASILGFIKTSQPNHAIKAAAMALVRTLATADEHRADVHKAHTDMVGMLQMRDDEMTVLNAIGCLTLLCSNEKRREEIKKVQEIIETLNKLRSTQKGGKKSSQAVQDRAKKLVDILGA
mmetsp:Transcript_40106/g.78603  ORF Transcript_40106/g.78603 Transcript_40106/m.78603 type:complete len:357 (+) Transcript_40106:217-1287(+)